MPALKYQEKIPLSTARNRLINACPRWMCQFQLMPVPSLVIPINACPQFELSLSYLIAIIYKKLTSPVESRSDYPSRPVATTRGDCPQ